MLVNYSRMPRNSLYHDPLQLKKKKDGIFFISISILLYLYANICNNNLHLCWNAFFVSDVAASEFVHLLSSSVPLCRYVQTAKEWTTKYATWFHQLWSWEESRCWHKRKSRILFSSILFPRGVFLCPPFFFFSFFLQKTTSLSFFHQALIRT